MPNNNIIKEQEQKLASNILNQFLKIITKHLYFNKDSYMSNNKDIYSVNIANLLKEAEETIIPKLLEKEIDFNIFLEHLLLTPPNITFPITVQKENVEKIKKEALEEIEFQTKFFWNSKPELVETKVKEAQETFLTAFNQGSEEIKEFILSNWIPSLSYLPYYLKENLQIKDKDEIDNLDYAIKEFYVLVIKALLINKKINPNFKTSNSNTFLHYIIENMDNYDQLDKILNFTKLFMEQGFNPNLENNNGDTILHLSFKKSLLHCRYSDNTLTNLYYDYLLKMTSLITDDKYDFQFTNDNSNNMIEDYFYGFNSKTGPYFDYKSHFFKCYPFLINSIRNLREINLEFDSKIERLTFFLNALGECKVEITDDKKDIIDTNEKDNLRKIIKLRHTNIINLEKEAIKIIEELIVFPNQCSYVADFILNGRIHYGFLPIYSSITNDPFANIDRVDFIEFVSSLWRELNDIELKKDEQQYIGPIKPKRLIKM